MSNLRILGLKDKSLRSFMSAVLCRFIPAEQLNSCKLKTLLQTNQVPFHIQREQLAFPAVQLV